MALMTQKTDYKDFSEWNAVKTNLHNSAMKTPNYKEGDIWWCSVGANVGFEEDGKGRRYVRPVLVVRGFSRRLVWGVPLSTTKSRGEYYFEFLVGESETSVALISQFRAFDTKRFGDFYKRVDKKTLRAVRERIVGLLNK
jgi:mRNA interferase MazF